MPELLRTYGELLQLKHDSDAVVFAALVIVILLLITALVIGASIEAAVRAWTRSRDHRHRSSSHVLPDGRR